jgi:SEC-C motif
MSQWKWSVMSDSPHSPGGAVVRSEGVTASERYLGKLCERSFLSLWSYPGVFRDQRRGNKGDGKEVCDLLVVFENHIIIFSDKHSSFADSGDLGVDWGRWYKKAVRKSAEQVWGAERWIKEFPNRLFVDRQCTVPFPILLPGTESAIFHRVAVAHDASRRCREVLGGSGSLMLDNSLIGDAHFDRPFTIGQVDPGKGYVHVFDDTTLDVVMSTLDTISDFTAYLTKKERFLTGSKVVAAAGEEELLAVYLGKMNSAGEHDFVIKGNFDALSFTEGFWDEFSQSPERRAQVERDRMSYAWDKLIEAFAFHARTGTQYFTSARPLNEQEIMFRFLAREPRTRRRLLAINLHEVLERSIGSRAPWEARVVAPSNAGDPHYVFLFVKRRPDFSDEEYRNVRMNLLSDYCHVAKLKFPEAVHIIGIASEAGIVQRRSEDLLYLNTSEWSAEADAKAREVQERLGLLKDVKPLRAREYEYPVDHTGRPRGTVLSRNSPCSCGSGKRFKRCCGRRFFEKRFRRK